MHADTDTLRALCAEAVRDARRQADRAAISWGRALQVHDPHAGELAVDALRAERRFAVARRLAYELLGRCEDAA